MTTQEHLSTVKPYVSAAQDLASPSALRTGSSRVYRAYGNQKRKRYSLQGWAGNLHHAALSVVVIRKFSRLYFYLGRACNPLKPDLFPYRALIYITTYDKYNIKNSICGETGIRRFDSMFGRFADTYFRMPNHLAGLTRIFRVYSQHLRARRDDSAAVRPRQAPSHQTHHVSQASVL